MPWARSPPDEPNGSVHRSVPSAAYITTRAFEPRRPEPDRIREKLGIPNGSPELRYGTLLRGDDYVDPVLSSGPWVATFSPVYDSGYAVVVQSVRRNERGRRRGSAAEVEALIVL